MVIKWSTAVKRGGRERGISRQEELKHCEALSPNYLQSVHYIFSTFFRKVPFFSGNSRGNCCREFQKVHYAFVETVFSGKLDFKFCFEISVYKTDRDPRSVELPRNKNLVERKMFSSSPRPNSSSVLPLRLIVLYKVVPTTSWMSITPIRKLYNWSFTYFRPSEVITP